MKTVTVKKTRLKKALQENMKTHVEDFDLAWEGYTKMVQDNLERLLVQAKKARKGEPIEVWVNLQAPENHSDDYARALEMLKWEIGEEVELTEQEFKQLVQDDWSWKHQVSSSNIMYTGSASPSKVRK